MKSFIKYLALIPLLLGAVIPGMTVYDKLQKKTIPDKDLYFSVAVLLLLATTLMLMLQKKVVYVLFFYITCAVIIMGYSSMVIGEASSSTDPKIKKIAIGSVAGSVLVILLTIISMILKK
jgi:hypothetical protein